MRRWNSKDCEELMRPEVARGVYRVLRFIFGDGRTYRLRACRRYVRRAGRWLWRRLEAATWEQVRFRIAQCVTMALLVLLLYVVMHIGMQRAAEAATSQMLGCLVPMDERLGRLEGRDKARTRLLLTAGAMASQMWESYENPDWPDLRNELMWDEEQYTGAGAAPLWDEKGGR